MSVVTVDPNRLRAADADPRLAEREKELRYLSWQPTPSFTP